MNRNIRKVILSADMESYDLRGGTPNIKLIFSRSCPLSGPRALPIFTHRISESVRQGSFWLKHVRYPYFALELILEGEMEYRDEEQLQIAGPGTLYLSPPGTTTRFTPCKGQDVRKLCVILSGENLKGILMTLKLSNSRMVPLSEPEVIERKMRGLKDAIAAPGAENSERTYHFLLELSELIGEDNSAQMPLMRAVSMLESGFQENLQIPDIAAGAGVSERTLRRLFHSELHCSPLDYLNSVRLKFAAGKLRNTSLRIKEIAQMSGFLSSARFCTVFQAKYRMTPGEFRKKELVKKTTRNLSPGSFLLK